MVLICYLDIVRAYNLLIRRNSRSYVSILASYYLELVVAAAYPRIAPTHELDLVAAAYLLSGTTH